MQLFYNPDILSDQHHLGEEESKHCIKVLRKTKGDIIHLTDGKGNLFVGEIIVDNPRSCHISIIEKKINYGKREYKIHLAVAPTKNIGRFEWFVEKATEIGIDEITPIICSNSERKVINHGRLEKIMISAIKQSGKTYLPKLNKIVNLEELLKAGISGAKYIAFIDDDVTQTMKHSYRKGEDVTILIGPEGDFKPAEIDSSKEEGFHPISLGKSRLRTETAAVVACNIVHLLNE